MNQQFFKNTSTSYLAFFASIVLLFGATMHSEIATGKEVNVEKSRAALAKQDAAVANPKKAAKAADAEAEEKPAKKAPAKKKFIAWVTTGSTYAGQRYKFTIDEIFEAVNYYVETKEEWREWKDFSTLMNQIPDFVEGAKERDK